MPEWVELGYLTDGTGWSWGTSSTSTAVTYTAAGAWNTTPVYVNTGTTVTGAMFNNAARDQYQRMVNRALDSQEVRPGPVETAEQREARLVSEREYQQRRQLELDEYNRQRLEAQRVREEQLREQQAIRQAASERASALLRAILTPDQIQSWENEDEFTVVGSAGGTFRVETNDYSGNIYKLNEDGDTAEEWCVHPVMYHGREHVLPTEDALITQVLALRTDEEAVRRTANVARY